MTCSELEVGGLHASEQKVVIVQWTSVVTVRLKFLESVEIFWVQLRGCQMWNVTIGLFSGDLQWCFYLSRKRKAKEWKVSKHTARSQKDAEFKMLEYCLHPSWTEESPDQVPTRLGQLWWNISVESKCVGPNSDRHHLLWWFQIDCPGGARGWAGEYSFHYFPPYNVSMYIGGGRTYTVKITHLPVRPQIASCWPGKIFIVTFFKANDSELANSQWLELFRGYFGLTCMRPLHHRC